MLVAALAAAALVPVSDGAHRGHGVTLVVRDRHVVRVDTRLRRFVCDPFGDVGPVRVTVRPDAPIARDGRVRFTAGPPSERLTLRARFRPGGRAGGRLRLRGTIGTGDPCASPLRRFVVDSTP